MGENWTRMALSDIAELRTDIVKPANLVGRVDLYSIPACDRGVPDRVSPSQVGSNKYSVPEGAVLVSRINPHIRRLWAPSLQKDVTSVCSTEFSVLTATNCEPDFLKFVVESDAICGRLPELVTGTSGSHQRVKPHDLMALTLEVPPRATQRRIAAVLAAVDELIRGSQQVSKLAGELSQLLVEQAAATCTVGELASTVRTAFDPEKHPTLVVDHYSLPAYDNGQVPERTAGSGIGSLKREVPDNCVLLSRLNPATNRTWLPTCDRNVGRSICSTEYAVLVPIEISAALLWAVVSTTVTLDQLAGRVTGTSASHQRVREADVLSVEIPDPRSLTDCVTDEAEAAVAVMLQRRMEMAALRISRHLLVPSLLSGALRVETAEERVEAVA